MNIIILGKPGSGKGTQAELLEEKMKIAKITIGDVLRKVKKQKTKLGKLVKERIDKGIFVPHKIVTQIVKERINKRDAKKGFILDGYPRDLFQAKEIDKMVDIDRVIMIDSKNDLIIKRLSSRRMCACGETYNLITNPPKKKGICDRCGETLYIRKDDKPATIRARLRIYNEKTKPVVDHYKKKGSLVKIDGNRTIKPIFKDVLKALE